MIIGIGTDIIEIERIQKAIQKESFIKKCFTAKELQFLFACPNPTQSMAANFAAKESFVKAVGCGFRDGITLQQIEVLRDNLGKPYLELSLKALEKKKELEIDSIFVSISHCQKYASATVIAERRNLDEGSRCATNAGN